ncbi:MAG: O-antigen ligase family protein [Nitrospirae bacterium]|nr:O-antigen ligase family protein [Nitrospirota bacterium]
MVSFRKIDNYYLWGIKGIIFLVPFIPICVTRSMVFPYITGKNFIFRILIEFAAVLWLGLISANKAYRPRNSALTLSVLIFTFIVGLADLLGVSPYNSFWSNYERMEGYITILHLALYFLIAGSVLRINKDWKIFINLFVVVSCFVSLYSLIIPVKVAPESLTYHTMYYGSRPHGTIGNPPFLASYLLLSVFLGLILLFNTHRIYLKLVYSLPVIINSIVIYFTASRGAILAAAIGTVIFILFHILLTNFSLKKKLIKKAALSLVIVLMVVSVGFIAAKHTDFIKRDRTFSRFATMFSDDSAQGRFLAWKYAWEGIKERPVLGWGQENFIGVYSVNTIPLVREQIWFDRAHNIIIEWLVSAGILGLFSYLAIFGAAFYILRTSFRKKTVSINEAVTIVTALVVYFIHNLFTFDTINTYLLFFTLLAYIGNIDCLNKGNGLKDHSDPAKNKIRAISVTLLALLFFSLIANYVHFKPVKESMLFVQISASGPENNSFTKITDDFDKALSLNSFGDSYASFGMKSVSNQIIRRNLFMEKGALEFIARTVDELEKGLTVRSHDLKFITDVILLYSLIANYEPSFIPRTEALINKGMQVNPEYQWLYMALADLCVLKKDYECSFANVKKVADWDNQNDEKQLKLALAAIYASREQIAKSALENVKKIRMARDENIAAGRGPVFTADELYYIATVYRERENYRIALQYYNELITALSYEDKLFSGSVRRLKHKAQIHSEIAQVYLFLGDKENAEREARKSSTLDPENIVR